VINMGMGESNPANVKIRTVAFTGGMVTTKIDRLVQAVGMPISTMVTLRSDGCIANSLDSWSPGSLASRFAEVSRASLVGYFVRWCTRAVISKSILVDSFAGMNTSRWYQRETDELARVVETRLCPLGRES